MDIRKLKFKNKLWIKIVLILMRIQKILIANHLLKILL